MGAVNPVTFVNHSQSQHNSVLAFNMAPSKRTGVSEGTRASTGEGIKPRVVLRAPPALRHPMVAIA
jgi:hypothetical protein